MAAAVIACIVRPTTTLDWVMKYSDDGMATVDSPGDVTYVPVRGRRAPCRSDGSCGRRLHVAWSTRSRGLGGYLPGDPQRTSQPGYAKTCVVTRAFEGPGCTDLFPNDLIQSSRAGRLRASTDVLVVSGSTLNRSHPSTHVHRCSGMDWGGGWL